MDQTFEVTWDWSRWWISWRIIINTTEKRTQPLRILILTSTLSNSKNMNSRLSLVSHVCSVVEDNKILLSQTLQNKMVIPDWQPFSQIIRDIFNKYQTEPHNIHNFITIWIFRCKSNTKGSVASYIPQLAKVTFSQNKFFIIKYFWSTNIYFQHSHDQWALSVCTVDGQRLSLGNVDQAFTLQSCSKQY